MSTDIVKSEQCRPNSVMSTGIVKSEQCRPNSVMSTGIVKSEQCRPNSVMSTGIVKSEQCSKNSVQVFWTIEKIGKKLEENYFLRSVPFYFAGQMWQPLLKTLFELENVFRIDFSISRITVLTTENSQSPRIPNSDVVSWNMAILDSWGKFHHGSTGLASLATVSDWVRVADFWGPQFKDLCLKKDLYIPGDKITIAIRLSLDSSDALIQVEEDSLPMIQEITIDVVVIEVNGKTFYAEGSILRGISHDLELEIYDFMDGGRMTVIELPDCDPGAFECFLSFACSGEIEGLTDDIAREVYDIAYMFQVPELRRECVQRLLRNLNVSSVSWFLEMAERYHDRDLKEECSKFFLNNAREILNTSEWLELMRTRAEVANELFISYLDSTGR